MDGPSVSPDVAAVRRVLDAATDALRARDAAALARLYVPDAWMADLAPPLLGRGFDVAATQAWLDGWDGPVELTARDEEITVSGDLALVQRLQHTRTSRGGEEAAWWSRATLALARTPDGWRVVHEHVSVPFHMDGSDRAALDLEP